jgi:hypothetical protein
MTPAIAVLDLIDNYLERDALVPQEIGQLFLELFCPDDQVRLMSRALQITVHLSKEDLSCPLPIALSVTD